MKQLLERCKRIFRRNGHGNVAVLDMSQAMAMSKRPDEDTWKPEKLSTEHQLMVLERVWFRINRELPPREEKVLFELEPPGLTEEEKNGWYYGARSEAAHRYLEIFNHSWSKTKLRENLAAEGLSNALELFDKETKDRIINYGIKYRSD